MSDDGSLAQPKDTYSGTAKVSYEGEGAFTTDSAMTAERISSLVRRLRDPRVHIADLGGLEREAADVIAALSAERTKLAADRARVEKHNAELQEKITEHDCCCSYDEPGAVCMTHSPALLAAEAKSARLAEALKALAEHPAIDCIVFTDLRPDQTPSITMTSGLDFIQDTLSAAATPPGEAGGRG